MDLVGRLPRIVYSVMYGVSPFHCSLSCFICLIEPVDLVKSKGDIDSVFTGE